MWGIALCAVLAPGAAARWALPEPTFAIPAIDTWTPAPTEAPGLGLPALFRRDFIESDTCGFFSGVSSSSFTCQRSGYQCATNTYWGAHGCCDPHNLNSCTLPTTCIPKTEMSKSCNSDCSKDDFITKCNGNTNTECYQFDFIYTVGLRTTTMKEFGCTDKAMTTDVPLFYKGYSSPGSGDTITSSTPTPSASPTSSDSNTPLPVKQGAGNPNNTPAIIGGVIGGLVIVGGLIFAIVFLFLRDRRRKREIEAQQQQQQHQDWPAAPSPAPGMVEYHGQSDGFIGCNVYGEEGLRSATPDPTDRRDWKAWGRVNRDQKEPKERVTSCADAMYAPIEAEGRQVHEAPA